MIFLIHFTALLENLPLGSTAGGSQGRLHLWLEVVQLLVEPDPEGTRLGEASLLAACGQAVARASPAGQAE